LHYFLLTKVQKHPQPGAYCQKTPALFIPLPFFWFPPPVGFRSGRGSISLHLIGDPTCSFLPGCLFGCLNGCIPPLGPKVLQRLLVVNVQFQTHPFSFSRGFFLFFFTTFFFFVGFLPPLYINTVPLPSFLPLTQLL